LAWDLSLFTTAEFGFVSLPPEYTTGSSIMPNKRNPDVIELLGQLRQRRRRAHRSRTVAVAPFRLSARLAIQQGRHLSWRSSRPDGHGVDAGFAGADAMEGSRDACGDRACD